MDSSNVSKSTAKVRYGQLNDEDGHGSVAKPHWQRPTIMLATWLCGISLAIGHHFFYQSWNGKVVASNVQQQWVIRGGTAFAFCVKMFLAISTSQAFVQQMWLNLEKSPHTISHIDSFFAVLSNALEFRHLRLWYRKPLLALTALLVWTIPISAIVSPGTLIIVQAIRPDVLQRKVNALDFSNADNYADDYGYNSGGSFTFGTPQPDLSRLGLASASSMVLFQASPPTPNCSYTMTFYAPALTCNPVSASRYQTFQKQVHQVWEDEGQVIAYFAWAGANRPDFNASSIQQYDDPSSFNLLDIDSVDAAQVSLYLDLDHSTSGSRPSMIHCSLQNVSFTLSFTFENSQQSLTVLDRTLLNGVSTNSGNIEQKYDLIGVGTSYPFIQHTVAYGQVMQVFNQILLGSITLLGENSADNLLRTVPFNTMALSTAFNNATQHASVTNETMASLAEELFQNLTFSLISSDRYTTNATTSPRILVSVLANRNIYAYAPLDLLLAYGVASLFTLIAVILGSIALWRHGLSYSTDFSSILRATRDPRLHRVLTGTHIDSSGADPTSDEVKEMKLAYSSRTLDRWAGFSPVDDPRNERIIRRKPVSFGTAS